MTVKQMQDRIDSLASHILFDYRGKSCGIDPLNRTKIDVWYGDESVTMGGVEQVMSAPFFDGKSLTEIFSDIDNIET